MTSRAKHGSVKARLVAAKPGDVLQCETEREAKSLVEASYRCGVSAGLSRNGDKLSVKVFGQRKGAV